VNPPVLAGLGLSVEPVCDPRSTPTSPHSDVIPSIEAGADVQSS
jgi:hypothetical protein